MPKLVAALLATAALAIAGCGTTKTVTVQDPTRTQIVTRAVASPKQTTRIRQLEGQLADEAKATGSSDTAHPGQQADSSPAPDSEGPTPEEHALKEREHNELETSRAKECPSAVACP